MTGKVEPKPNQDKNEAGHKGWVKEEFDETRREKKRIFGFQKKLFGKFDFRNTAWFKGKFTHGTQGKPTHGPRGNQG